ncbi:ABC transporter permease [Streptomyces sp. TRM68367]|uniref:ABC transporter permease n=1 Tax=Streptomyces sp. TRM68367 TaxID=2758415 RepID=UPI00165C24E3|nr:ABC transporter permease [Streptomyces sp. TRM68367]MBC9727772.1 ABC transporter permease [Streptomyces sp. TRM68367]
MPVSPVVAGLVLAGLLTVPGIANVPVIPASSSAARSPRRCSGAFVGMPLAGVSPVLAGAVRVFVLIALLAVEALSVALTVALVARRKLHRETGKRS